MVLCYSFRQSPDGRPTVAGRQPVRWMTAAGRRSVSPPPVAKALRILRLCFANSPSCLPFGSHRWLPLMFLPRAIAYALAPTIASLSRCAVAMHGRAPTHPSIANCNNCNKPFDEKVTCHFLFCPFSFYSAISNAISSKIPQRDSLSPGDITD